MTGITQTSTSSEESAQISERIYAPPESLAQRPFTIQGDVYALGVLLYQMIVGDLTRPLAHGWEADILDPLLCEDIACCVAGRPEQRLSSANELGLRLRTLNSRRGEKRKRTLLRSLAATCVILLFVLIPAMIVGGLFDYNRGIGMTSSDEFLHELQHTQIVNKFLTDTLLVEVERSVQAGNTQNVSLHDMLDDASELIDNASKTGGIYHEQPLVEASIRTTLGIAYWKLGKELKAKHHLDQARSIWRRELGTDSDPTLSLNMQKALTEYKAIMNRDSP